MVNTYHDGCKTTIIAKPNRSASWEFNRTLIIIVTVVSLIIAFGFAFVGAWMILPFSGIEILALSASLYYVSWKLTYQHVIIATGNAIIVEKGYYRPKQGWTLNRAELTLCITETDSSHATAISIISPTENIPIGGFLTALESGKLLAELQQLQLPIRNFSQTGNIQC